MTGIRTHVPTCEKVTKLPTELPGRLQKFIRVAYSCRAVLVFVPRQSVNESKTSTYVGVCAPLVVVLYSYSFVF